MGRDRGAVLLQKPGVADDLGACEAAIPAVLQPAKREGLRPLVVSQSRGGVVRSCAAGQVYVALVVGTYMYVHPSRSLTADMPFGGGGVVVVVVVGIVPLHCQLPARACKLHPPKTTATACSCEAILSARAASPAKTLRWW